MTATDNHRSRAPGHWPERLGLADRLRRGGPGLDKALLDAAPAAGLIASLIATSYAVHARAWADLILIAVATAICARAAYLTHTVEVNILVRVAGEVARLTGLAPVAGALWRLFWRLAPSAVIAGLGALIADGWFASAVHELPISPLLTGSVLVAAGIGGVLEVAWHYLHAATVEVDGVYHRGDFADVDAVHLEWVDDLGGPAVASPILRPFAWIHRAWAGPGGWQLTDNDGRVIRIDTVHGDPDRACREATRVVRWLCGWKADWQATTVDGDPFIAVRPDRAGAPLAVIG